MRNSTICLLSLFLLLVACATKPQTASQGKEFARVENGEFYIGDSVYRYVGTNFWYGAILASEGRGGDRERLARELDLMQKIGIDNVRVLVGADGREGIPSHVQPVLQTAPGVYNDTLLQGLDYLMAELEKRNMKAVLFLNNAWEWSGGYGSYLEWAGEGEAPVPSIDGWPQYMEYVSHFVTNDSAKKLALDHVKNMVGRINTVTGEPYSESPAIFSWQIANEPRVFSENPESKEAFADWILETARTIKSIDPNHMVSTGSEGRHGCEQDIDLWNKIHTYPEIDYGIVHLWPYNWSWINQETLIDSVGVACANTVDYLRPHSELMKAAGKPLVLEEFGYPRDKFQFTPGSPTKGRDTFYKYVFDLITDTDMIAGCNFWGWGGYAEPVHIMWEEGDAYVCDPAQEEQGLNSVFANDSTTLAIISESVKRMKR